MPWAPLALTVPQYHVAGVPASGYVLKPYAAGTSTPINFATGSTGATEVGSIALNSAGYPEVSGNVVIPHIDQDYKLALYPDQASADANSGATWSVDNLSAYAQASILSSVAGTNTITATANPTISSYTADTLYWLTPANTNTDAVTANIDSVGAGAVQLNGAALVGGELVADVPVQLYVTADTPVFEIVSNGAFMPKAGGTFTGAVTFGSTATLNAEPAAALEAVPLRALAGYINGLQLSNDTDADHDIAIAAGVAVDATTVQMMRLAATLTKQIDVDWAEGDDAGGFPSALTLSTSTWYHVFVIAKTDGTVDAGFDTSLTAANLLADATGYTLYRRIGSVLTDGSSNITPFIQVGGDFTWSTPVQDVSAAPVTTAAAITLSVPTGVRCMAKVVASLLMVDSTYEHFTSYYPTDAAARTPDVSTSQLRARAVAGVISERNSIEFGVLTDTSAQINHDSDNTNGTLTVLTIGWHDYRGAA